jgi:hypothetical protein
MAVLALAAGAVAALSLVYAVRRRPADARRRVYAAGLIVAALVYVGFAAAGHAPAAWLGYELLGVAVFGAVAWAGTRDARVLAAGWALHTVWDLVPHLGRRPGATYTPQWYPWLCVSFDLLVAGAVLGWPRWPARLAAPPDER